MLFKPFGFDQRKAMEYNLNHRDLLLIKVICEDYTVNGITFIDIPSILFDYPILRMKKARLYIAIKKLQNMGFLNKIRDSKKVEILKRKNNHNKGIGHKSCQWCGIKSTVLTEHHYPVPRSKGGTKTVEICSICHEEFHQNNFYQINNGFVKNLSENYE